jgi:CubicO group peptidase (beta-lactamase class C family)
MTDKAVELWNDNNGLKSHRNNSERMKYLLAVFAHRRETFYKYLRLAMMLGAVSLAGFSGAVTKPAAGVSGDYSPVSRYIAAMIAREMKANKVVGLSIALVDDQKIVWAQGFGFADKAKHIPATPETIYRIGLFSKLFTDIGALQLADQNKIDIDKPLTTYLPEFSIKNRYDDVSPITLRSLMTHHSGLPRDYLKGEWTKRPEPFERLPEYLKDEYAAYPPNFVYHYSNIGVTLLGIVIEKISGEPFAGYMQKYLFEPMGMSHSSFSCYPDRSLLMSRGYLNGKEADELPIRDIPMGGMNSTVMDLGRFMSMIFADGESGGRQVLKPQTIAEMFRPQNSDVAFDGGVRVGLGWFLSAAEGNVISIENAGVAAHHEGGTIRFASEMIVLPEHKLGVAVLVNSTSAMQSARKVAVKALSLALETKTGIRQPEETPKQPPVAPLSPALADKYIGTYAMPFGFGALRVYRTDGNLRVEMFGRVFHVVPHADGTLGPKYDLFGFIPLHVPMLADISLSLANINGRDFMVMRSKNQELCAGEKVKPAPVSPAWKKRLGAYECVNLEKDFNLISNLRLAYADNMLVLEYSLWNRPGSVVRVPLAAVSDTEALMLHRIAGMGETVRVVLPGRKELMEYSGYYFRKK